MIGVAGGESARQPEIMGRGRLVQCMKWSGEVKTALQDDTTRPDFSRAVTHNHQPTLLHHTKRKMLDV